MIDHLVKWFKAPPKQIGIGSTPETRRRKFINTHGDVGRLNKVNLAGLYRSEAKRVDLDFLKVPWRISFTRHRQTLIRSRASPP
ncbi:hypothetical protein TNCV_174741 [Trichonephila clavipes]|nr:hypothetical protein TNCV_174741 [Trichonephila clavipes]